ncbi:hypothetical protein [Mesorhizobium sp. M5C.F.Cr.IN.023.01.1.1]|uniref:hypothetical protein n=1 Tax=Mesorhizobium sp. M5C.F.Cr.IN.023.01.1.1 TaxID=2496768 RepID=UPI0013E37C40|nr:hypothetical protein [Mesorhizobium sp. M5C.F.Cr.IN.023.01.1.1]
MINQSGRVPVNLNSLVIQPLTPCGILIYLERHSNLRRLALLVNPNIRISVIARPKLPPLIDQIGHFPVPRLLKRSKGVRPEGFMLRCVLGIPTTDKGS